MAMSFYTSWYFRLRVKSVGEKTYPVNLFLNHVLQGMNESLKHVYGKDMATAKVYHCKM